MLQLKTGDNSGSASQYEGAKILASANPSQAFLDAASQIPNILDPTVEIEKFAKDFQRSLGASDKFAESLQGYLSQAANELNVMAEGSNGITLATQYMSEYMDEFGRQTVISNKSMINLLANSKVLGVSSKDLISNFASIGKEISSINEVTKILAIEAMNFSVPLSQVADDVIPNLSKLNEFGFNNGIEGLAKMSIQSRRLKLDMEETFSLATDLFSPEKALETAAFFQRMGVVNAELTDAFALQDIARNRVDDLQTAIADMASTFLEFDEETQQFKVPASSVDDLQAISKQTGIAYQDLVRSGGELLKMQSRTKQLGDLNLDYSQSQLQQLEGMMELLPNKEGGLSYQVTFTTSDGETITKELDKLTARQKIELEEYITASNKINQSAEEFVKGNYEGTKSIEAQRKEIETANKNAIGLAIAEFGGVDILKSALTVYQSTSKAFIDNFSLSNTDFKTFLTGFNANLQGVVTNLANANVTGAIGQLTEAASSLASFAGSAGLSTLTGALSNLTSSLQGFTGVDFSGFQTQIETAKAALENFTKSLNLGGSTGLIPQLSLPEFNIPGITSEPTSQNTNTTNVNGKVELIFKTDGSFTAKQVDDMASQLTKSGNAQKFALAIEKAVETRTA